MQPLMIETLNILGTKGTSSIWFKKKKSIYKSPQLTSCILVKE